MAKNSDKFDELARSRRPTASATISACIETENVSRETSYETMLEISLSLMSYVRSEIGAVMIEAPEVAEDLGPMLKVMHEVTLDLETHRQFVEAQ